MPYPTGFRSKYSLSADCHRQYLAHNPNGYCGLPGWGCLQSRRVTEGREGAIAELGALLAGCGWVDVYGSMIYRGVGACGVPVKFRRVIGG